jgi:6-phosphofructokinase 2
MVYTITLNPALDRNIWIEKVRMNDSNRIQKEKRYAAGKGIDVSRVLTTFGIRNKALGFVGGFDGEEMEGRLLNEGMRPAPTSSSMMRKQRARPYSVPAARRSSPTN